MAKKITITNLKGGIAKSTTVANVGACLARNGLDVLIVDCDAQADCTTNLYPEKKPEKTILDLFRGTPVRDVIMPSIEPGLDIIPSCLAFANIELEMASQISRETILKRALAPIENDYDVILFDTHSALTLSTINTLCAADEAIIPVYEAYCLNAASQLATVIVQVKNTINPDIKVGGVLLTMYDPRTNLSKEVREILVNNFGELLFNTTIPRNVKLAECPTHKQSIFEYAPESAGAQAYAELTKEIMTRWERK